MSVTSGFFDKPSDIRDSAMGEPELLFDSPEGYSCIWKTNFDGQFRVLKGLKEQYRGEQAYEAMLKKEFEIGHGLSHPNICEYISMATIPDLGNCIIMEWVDGCTLEEILSEVRRNRALRLKVISELCEALKYTHSKQVVHRDLKPENILITRNGRNVKLIDFGLADTDRHSYLKGPAGTPAYAAPEVVEGRNADCRSDIYSLGMIIAQMGESRRLKRIADKCMNDDPDKRYNDITSLQNALRRHQSHTLLIAMTVILASTAAILIAKYNDRSRCSAADIDSIFEQATEMIEEAAEVTENNDY